jgi:AraC family transcriptional regulator of adaptative response/methylated-DNA-[protein]-cysteine methyltransferase
MMNVTMEPTSFGLTLVATTQRGVRAVLFGDSEAALLAELEARFSEASVERVDGTRDHVARAVLRTLDGKAAAESVPLDLEGTDFQMRVWRALCEIPAGMTVTYAELARRLGTPRAARAVGSACGKNHVAVLVPCHRVVREDGGLGGYRWGLPIKRALIERERVDARA